MSILTLFVRLEHFLQVNFWSLLFFKIHISKILRHRRRSNCFLHRITVSINKGLLTDECPIRFSRRLFLLILFLLHLPLLFLHSTNINPGSLIPKFNFLSSHSNVSIILSSIEVDEDSNEQKKYNKDVGTSITIFALF